LKGKFRKKVFPNFFLEKKLGGLPEAIFLLYLAEN